MNWSGFSKYSSILLVAPFSTKIGVSAGIRNPWRSKSTFNKRNKNPEKRRKITSLGLNRNKKTLKREGKSRHLGWIETKRQVYHDASCNKMYLRTDRWMDRQMDKWMNWQEDFCIKMQYVAFYLILDSLAARKNALQTNGPTYWQNHRPSILHLW